MQMSDFMPEGYCDLATCFDTVGRALFPKDWSGTEFQAEIIPTPMKRKAQLARLEADRKAGVTKVEGPTDVTLASLVSAPPPQHWEGLGPESDEYEDLYQAGQRKTATREALRQALFAARLEAWILSIQGARYPVPARIWATEMADLAYANEHIQFYDDATSYENHRSGKLLFRDKDVEAAIRDGAFSGRRGRDANRAERKRGPKEKYSETELFALMAWDGDTNGLPAKQADLVRRMEDICQAVWGEDRTPGQTWFKKRAKFLLEQRPRFEKGRQLLENGQDTEEK